MTQVEKLGLTNNIEEKWFYFAHDYFDSSVMETIGLSVKILNCQVKVFFYKKDFVSTYAVA